MALTPQEVFNTVKTHLLTQNVKSLIPDHPSGMCAYLTDEGLMCAAGRLIPANLYDPEIETKGIDWVFTRWPEVAAHIGHDNLRLVERLQDLHDNI